MFGVRPRHSWLQAVSLTVPISQSARGLAQSETLTRSLGYL